MMSEPRFTNHGDRLNWRGQQANAPVGHVITGPRDRSLSRWLCRTCGAEWDNEAHPTGTFADANALARSDDSDDAERVLAYPLDS